MVSMINNFSAQSMARQNVAFSGKRELAQKAGSFLKENAIHLGFQVATNGGMDEINYLAQTNSIPHAIVNKLFVDGVELGMGVFNGEERITAANKCTNVFALAISGGRQLARGVHAVIKKLS